MKELLIIKEPLSLIVTVSTSCSLALPPPLLLSHPLSLSLALYPALSCPPSLDFLLKAERKYGTFPNWFFSSSCISNCVFTNKLGEVAEDICPGARPVYSFQLCAYELCVPICLLPLTSLRYQVAVLLPPLHLPHSPSSSSFPSSTSPSSSSTCSLPTKPGGTDDYVLQLTTGPCDYSSGADFLFTAFTFIIPIQHDSSIHLLVFGLTLP